jgi:formate C-acetyltransferase
VDVEGYRGIRHYFSPEEFLSRERLYVEGLERHGGEPQPLARAHALAHTLDNMPVRIEPGELIVGSKLGVYVNPAALSPSQRDDLNQLRRRRAEAERIPGVQLSTEETAAMQSGLYSAGGCTGHCVPDYASVIGLGFEGLRQKVLERSAKSREDSRGRTFLESVRIVLEAAIRFAERHAEAAESLVKCYQHDTTNREAVEIAVRCRRVPRLPSESFHDALQSLWLAHVVLYFESPQTAAISPGRLDQILLPFFERDITVGKLSLEDGVELIECLWIKLQEGDESQNVTLGGRTRSGEEAANKLTELMLDVTARLRLPQPSISVRVHPKSPSWLYEKIAGLARASSGQPSVFNDTVIEESLERVGVVTEDARDYAIVGCYEPVVPGKTYCWTTGGNIFLPKCIELALNAGACPYSGKQVGPATPARDELRKFDALFEAFMAQVFHAIELHAQTRDAHWRHFAEHHPRPYESALHGDCIANARDLSSGGARYNAISVSAIGLANAADGLAALRKLVYDEKRFTLDEILDAMRADFDGREDLRLALESAPRYGNDDSRVDGLAEGIGRRFCEKALERRSACGPRYWPSLGMFMQHLAGRNLGAGPDGRRRGEPLSFGAGPVPGRNQRGPTAVLRSVARLPHTLCPNGSNFLTLTLPPSALKGGTSLANFAALIRTYFDLGGMHLMFNVVDAATLRDAKQRPQLYRDLLVRISGLSAYFIQLDPSLQDDLIARTSREL